MATKKKSTDTNEDQIAAVEDQKPEVEPKKTKPVQSDPKMHVDKFLASKGDFYLSYGIRRMLKVVFHGQMKTESEWERAVESELSRTVK